MQLGYFTFVRHLNKSLGEWEAMGGTRTSWERYEQITIYIFLATILAPFAIGVAS